MVKEFFNPEKGCLESFWEGEISLQEIVAYIRRTKKNKDYPRRLKILTHAEKAILSLKLSDLEVISEENRLSLEKYDIIIDAFIVDASIMVALSSMYEQVSAVPAYYFKVFSTTDAAIGWLSGF